MNSPDVRTNRCPRFFNPANKHLIILADIVYGIRSFIYFVESGTYASYIYETTTGTPKQIEDDEEELFSLLKKAIEERKINMAWEKK